VKKQGISYNIQRGFFKTSVFWGIPVSAFKLPAYLGFLEVFVKEYAGFGAHL
jgi:hypothetical protein